VKRSGTKDKNSRRLLPARPQVDGNLLIFTEMKHIRNFLHCILITEKSTLADRLLGATQTVTAREEGAIA
jgi:hypothetical protein